MDGSRGYSTSGSRHPTIECIHLAIRCRKQRATSRILVILCTTPACGSTQGSTTSWMTMWIDTPNSYAITSNCGLIHSQARLAAQLHEFVRTIGLPFRIGIGEPRIRATYSSYCRFGLCRTNLSSLWLSRAQQNMNTWPTPCSRLTTHTRGRALLARPDIDWLAPSEGTFGSDVIGRGKWPVGRPRRSLPGMRGGFWLRTLRIEPRGLLPSH